MQFQVPVGQCPACDNDGVKVYATLEKNGVGVVCKRGHAFTDMNDFTKNITKQERKKMRKEKQEIKPVPAEAGTTKSTDGQVIPAIEQPKPTDIILDEINKARLEALVGDFNDASSLVGRIFALNEEKKAAEKTIKNARRLKIDREDGEVVASGDLKIELFIPERHVEPLVDLAHSWNKTVGEHINERAATLFDDMLFY